MLEGYNKRYLLCLQKALSFYRSKSAHIREKRKNADILAINVGRNFKIDKSAEREVKNVSVITEK